MSKFNKVKKYYEAGLWDIVRVANAVVKSWITEVQFKEITGTDFRSVYVQFPNA